MLVRKISVVVLALVVISFIGACGDEKKDSTQAGADSGACAEGQTELSGGLCYEDTKVGDGPEAQKGDVVSMKYVGKLEDGTVFDQTKKGDDPLQFQLGAGAVIQGWDEGIPGMKVGGERTLTIPPDLAYGAAGYPPVIPPNATLIFDVQLVAVEPSK